ncbi:hypothetical protein [Corynebacterium camporealensis]
MDQTFEAELAEHARLLRPVVGDAVLYDAVVKIAELIDKQPGKDSAEVE